jgi:hypothetical protein
VRGSGPVTGWPRRSAFRSSCATGFSILVVSGSAAVAAALLTRWFGRTAETDGLLVAYGVYVVGTVAAQAFRMVVVPELTRAAFGGDLGAETRGYAAFFVVIAVPLTILAFLLASPLSQLLTGNLPPSAAAAAGEALGWLVLAAGLQLLAALAASALAARGSYEIAAFGYTVGAVAGVGLFAAVAAGSGVVGMAWGLALNGALSAGIPCLALVIRGELVRGSSWRMEPARRMKLLMEGSALPAGLQVMYLISLRAAAGLGVGYATTFSYAYMAAAVLMMASASSLALVSIAPLTGRGISPEDVAGHVGRTTWLSTVPVFGGAVTFVLCASDVVPLLLGPAYRGEPARELAIVVIALAPWMLASIAVTLTFPLLFVIERRRVVFPVTAAVVVLYAPAAWIGRETLGLAGIALALAVATFLALASLLAAISIGSLTRVAASLGGVVVWVGLPAVASLGAGSVMKRPVVGAAVGLSLFTLLLAILRPRGLREAVTYLRRLR